MQTRELNHPTAAERKRVSQILTDAFWRTPMFSGYLFRGRKTLAKWFLNALLQYSITAGRVFVTEEDAQGIVACALWSLPDSPEMGLSTYRKTGMWPWMLLIAVCSPNAMARIGELFRMLERFAPETACVTLEFLASAKKGAGARVVWDSMPVFAPSTLYVESIVSQNDHAFYKQFGFEPFAKTDFHGTDYAFMLRPDARENGKR